MTFEPIRDRSLFMRLGGLVGFEGGGMQKNMASK